MEEKTSRAYLEVGQPHRHYAPPNNNHYNQTSRAHLAVGKLYNHPHNYHRHHNQTSKVGPTD